MNVKLLRRVKRHILLHPDEFLMRAFIVIRDIRPYFYADDRASRIKFAECNTAACIAGRTVLLGDGKEPRRYLDIPLRAALLLELKSGEGFRLFLTHYWPSKFHDAYDAAKTQRTRAKVAAARIDHFILTEGRE